MTTRQSLVLAVFRGASEAQRATRALGDAGVETNRISMFGSSAIPDGAGSDTLAAALAASDRHDLAEALTSLGVSDGEARFYAQEVQTGATLVLVEADARVEEIRKLMLERGGYDVRSRGAELARNPGAGVPGGTPVRPMDATNRWEDVRSRYAMLWQQHYGTTHATWEQIEPLYRWAWQAANDVRNYGRPWSEVASSVREQWQSSTSVPDWRAVAGPIRDVWEDVAEEAAQGTEGGADRRIPGPGTDQSVAARDLRSTSSRDHSVQ